MFLQFEFLVLIRYATRLYFMTFKCWRCYIEIVTIGQLIFAVTITVINE